MILIFIQIAYQARMNNDIRQSDVLFRLLKLIIAQYLSSFHEFPSFQQQSLRALTTFLLRNALRLAEDVKKVITMQSRTEPNALHLLIASQLAGSLDMQRLLQFMIKRRQQNKDMRSLAVIQKLGKKVFENDIQSLNRYTKDKQSSNIRYVEPVYLTANAPTLKFYCSLDECYPLPPDVTYRETSEKIIGNPKNVEYLVEYTRRENRIAMMGVIRNQEKKKDKNPQKQEEGKPNKKIKFDPIAYL